MSTVDIALNAAKVKNLPYWKLYKGTDRISQCDVEENPTGSPDEAYRQLVEELGQRPAGSYKLNIYRTSKGDKSGFKYEFLKQDSNQYSNRTTMNGMSTQDIYAQAERDIKILNLLEQLNKKVDAIGEFIVSQNDDDDDNNGDALKKMSSVFSFINQMKGMAGAAATTAAASGAANGFRGLR